MIASMLSPSSLSRLIDPTATRVPATTQALRAIIRQRLMCPWVSHGATGQVAAGTLILFSVTLLVDRPWLLPMPDARIWAAFLGIALLCTALAYLIYFRILALAGATNLLLVTFLLPVSALCLGVAFLGETVSTQAILGMALIGFGLAAIDGRPWHALHGRKRAPGPT